MTETRTQSETNFKLAQDLFDASRDLAETLRQLRDSAARDLNHLAEGMRPFGTSGSSVSHQLGRKEERWERALDLVSWGTDLNSDEISHIVVLGQEEDTLAGRRTFFEFAREHGWLG